MKTHRIIFVIAVVKNLPRMFMTCLTSLVMGNIVYIFGGGVSTKAKHSGHHVLKLIHERRKSVSVGECLTSSIDRKTHSTSI